MIMGIVGALGSGKTLLLAYLLSEFHNLGRDIYSNFGLTFPHTQITFEDMENFNLKNCALGLDEMQIWLDCRCSMSKQSRIISYFILQTRKRYVDLLFTSQNFNQVEFRLRNQTNYLVECQELRKNLFKYLFMNMATFESKAYVLYATKGGLYSAFDTEEIIQIPRQRK